MKISEMTSHDVRAVFVAFALALPLLIVACDPGVTIHQADSLTETGKSSGVILRVKSTHQFIGDTRYVAQVTVTNALEAPVLVTGIELATKQKIYSDSSPRRKISPKRFCRGKPTILRFCFGWMMPCIRPSRSQRSCVFTTEMGAEKILLA